MLLSGFGTTLQIFVLTLVGSIPLAVPVALARMSKIRPLALLARIYISVMRGTPLMLQMFAIYFAPYYVFGIRLTPDSKWYACIVAFIINYAAYFAEIYRSGIQSIPRGQYEAAEVLGYTKVQTFFRIVLPNAKPAIATTAILSFRSVWNEFLWPMLVINDYDKLTLTVGLKYLKEWEPNWAVLLAGASLSIVPIVIVFLIFQKQFMASTMNSGFGGK